MTEKEMLNDLSNMINRIAEANLHYAFYKTDYGLACIYCSDKARENSENKNIFIMSPCLELDAILKSNEENGYTKLVVK